MICAPTYETMYVGIYIYYIYIYIAIYTVCYVELGDIMILSFIVILKCHDNQNQTEIFNIVISPTRYYRKYYDYWKIHCSETFISVEYFHNFSA